MVELRPPAGGHVGVSGAQQQDQPAEGAAAQEAVRGFGPLRQQGMAQTRRDREQGQALQSQVGPGDWLTDWLTSNSSYKVSETPNTNFLVL